MRVAVFNGTGRPITIEDVDDDALGPGQLRIEVTRCGNCEACGAGRPPFCQAGVSQFGGFDERLIVTERSVFRLPSLVSDLPPF